LSCLICLNSLSFCVYLIPSGDREWIAPINNPMFFIPLSTTRSGSGTFFSKKSVKEILGLLIPRNVCRLAPPRSASIRITLLPCSARQIPTLLNTKLFPVPPLPPPTVQISGLRLLIAFIIIYGWALSIPIRSCWGVWRKYHKLPGLPLLHC